MRYWLLLAAPLVGCAAADNDVPAGPQVVEVRGADPDDCSVSVAGMSQSLAATAFNDLTKEQDVLITANPDTAYECVTDVLDELNDQRFRATIDETSWSQLVSVKQGQEKLQQDLAGESGHPEARPFDREQDAQADLDAALEKAAESGNNVLLVMGANWCHDSRALSGWFASPRFKRMIADQYELVFVDVGQKDRNIDIAQSFGIETIKGTPTVLVVSPEAQHLNSQTAPTWRNAASRSEAEVFDYFANFRAESQ